MSNPIPKTEYSLMEPLVGSTMLELGNKKNPAGVYKVYFESIGFQHTSVDWNGQDGALKLDLRQPLELGQFDMVTNIGTTEHVSTQKPVWENIHNACKVGGVIINVTPAEGDWWWHGTWYPRTSFFQQFAELNGYDLERLYIDQQKPNRCVFARLCKIKSQPFVMPDASTMFKNAMRPR